MNIISLFYPILQDINQTLLQNPYFYELESKIKDVGQTLTIEMLKQYLEAIDKKYKNSKERKDIYYVQCTRKRTLITSIGLVTFNKTYYKSKRKINGKYEFFSFIEEILGLEKWAKMSINAEVDLVNMALDVNTSYAAANAIPNYPISRQAVSTKINKLKFNLDLEIKKSSITPEVIYIEADEAHVNLQKKRNKIVPNILIHEGHKETYKNKRKELLNKFYISSSKLKVSVLWNEVYKYLDTKYNIDNIKYIFVSGDGAKWIRSYVDTLPNAIFVFDKFHYKKALNSIFSRNQLYIKLADDYLRNNKIHEFNDLVNIMVNLKPDRFDKIIKNRNLLLRNIDGIINQDHPMYKTPCSMEGHISHNLASHLTSRPKGYSLDGLENTVQLLTMKANGISLDVETYLRFKHALPIYKILNDDNSFSYNIPKDTFNKNKYIDLTYNIPILVYKNSGTRTLINKVIYSKKNY